jgi:hypothetical protein
MITCLKCGAQNRRKAKFCSSCGADLSPLSVTQPTRPDKDRSTGVIQTVKRWVAGTEPAPEAQPPPSQTATRPLPPNRRQPRRRSAD